MTLDTTLAIAAVAAWLLLTWYTLLRPSARRAGSSRRAAADAPRDARIAVVYASQTGTAIELAQRTAQAFGGRAALLPMDAITPEQLGAYEQILFIVSTYGEGDAPDMAQAFHERMFAAASAGAGAGDTGSDIGSIGSAGNIGGAKSAGTIEGAGDIENAGSIESLRGLQAGILALGDGSYRHFCGFGMALDDWLRRQGATLLFDTVRVDRGDPRALAAWSEHLARLFQVRLDADTQFDAWTLVGRTVANPSGVGQPCHELLWRPAAGVMPDDAQDDARSNTPNTARGDASNGTPRNAPGNAPNDVPGSAPSSEVNWQAGDIARIQIGDSGEHREYSIASIPSEGVLRLLVRRHQRPDGAPGLGSRWLGTELPVGGTARLHIRSNPLFRAPGDDRPAIFIGNGTGIAGLRALLQERISRGHHDNWLVFGERTRAGDFHWGQIFETWLQEGRLRRMDLAFSRDQAEKRYVHHLLREAAPTVREWAGRGAVLYVCGSKDGMAHDVDHALRDILGPHGYEALMQRHGYRRDVY